MSHIGIPHLNTKNKGYSLLTLLLNVDFILVWELGVFID